MKVQITKQARTALAWALIGGLVGAIGSIVYARVRNRGPEAGETLAAAKEEVLSVQRIGSLVWAVITLIREILDFGSGNE